MSLHQVVYGLVSAAILALMGWVYTTSQRVTVVETTTALQAQQLHDIHDDVRDLRNNLLGPKDASHAH